MIMFIWVLNIIVALIKEMTHGTRPQKRGKNISMMGAITVKGIATAI